MTDQKSIIAWAKSHKKAIVKEYLNRYDFPTSDPPNVIFMAGVPGAGKTEFANRLIPQLTTPPLHIDMDEIACRIDDHKPKIAHLFRVGATIILERLYDQAIKRGIDILMDGTFGHTKATDNVERALNHGYKVRIYFISPDPLTAWRKTKDREIIEHRSIDPGKFVETYYLLLNNLKIVHQKFGGKVPISIVEKDDQNRLKDIIESISIVEKYLEPALTKEDLLDRIKA